MRFLLLTACVGAIGCGGSTPESLASIGWSFNYRDWTRTHCAASVTTGCTDDDVRGCDNAPAQTTGAAYAAVASVRLLVNDPLGQVAPFDETFDCSRGSVGQRIDVRGIARQSYDLNVSALAADGTVLYRYDAGGFDLSSKRVVDVELRTVTGELHFYPSFVGTTSGLCAAGIESIRYTAIDSSDAAVLTATQAACDDEFAAEVFIRNIPSVPVQTQVGGYTPIEYISKLEALDVAGTVQYCSTQTRYVSPGDNNLADNQQLDAGECP